MRRTHTVASRSNSAHSDCYTPPSVVGFAPIAAGTGSHVSPDVEDFENGFVDPNEALN
jgi:hypothetical protein